ncbi:MAG TPA: hypothetical protein VFC41_02525 [Anaerovoracaceae bacterium]|nr:hypothetical protein [Anaerovoracaceae bacterium]
MRLWATEIWTINKAGEIILYRGPNIEAPSWTLAEVYCQENGLGYCEIKGELIEEGTITDGKLEKVIDYKIIQNN